jgi:hypothetical protein
MKKLIAILLLLFATNLIAQEKKDEDYNTNRELKSKVFEVHNREPRDLYNTLRLLGSGFKGAAISYSQDLRTITVRDYAENVASIEEALKRLDQPAPPASDIELKISVLVASKSPLTAGAVPEDLESVVAQLKKTLRYSHYSLMATTVQRTRSGRGVDGSGVAEATMLGLKAEDSRPIIYSYKLDGVTVGANAIDVGNFNFQIKMPINVGTSIQYQAVGFETPVSLKPNEKVVIGTTTMGDKALIVVVTAR